MAITLLEVVQRYLNATDGFYVDDIGSTEESEQASIVAQEVYERLTEDLDYRQFKRHWGQLDSVSDLTKPNYLFLPDDISKVSESQIYYNVAEEDATATIDYSLITYVEPLEFLNIVNKNSDTEDNTEVITDFDGATYVIHNDRFPTYCTSFNGEYVVFDSYNKTDTTDTLVASRTQIVYFKPETFLLENDFEIPLPNNMIQGYIDMVKAEASETLRQEALPSASRRARAFVISERYKGDKIGNKQSRRKPYGRKKQGNYKTKVSRL